MSDDKPMKFLEATEYAKLPWGEYVFPVDMLPEVIRRARRVQTDYDNNVSDSQTIPDVRIIPMENAVAFNVSNALKAPTTGGKK